MIPQFKELGLLLVRSLRFHGVLYLLGRLSIFILAMACSEYGTSAADSRSMNGLLALYDFSESEGSRVNDLSNSGRPLHLVISDPGSVEWLDGALRILQPAVIRSEEVATGLNAALRFTGELTIEAWIRPAKVDQSGPARVVTLSKTGSERNFTLGQDGARWDFRLRTTRTTGNGTPSVSSHNNAVRANLTHVVYSRDRNGQARIFVDGVQSTQQRVDGDFSNWDNTYHLGLANELSGDRSWLGDLHLVAIYNRALASVEIENHFKIGADSSENLPAALKESKQLTEADISRQIFREHVAPIFAAHCIECHDPVTREGKLDLTQRITAMADRRKGNAITPHSLDDSKVWKMTISDEMPEDRPPLTAEQKDHLKRWIESGAKWDVEVIDPTIYQLDQGPPVVYPQRLTVNEYIQTIRALVGVDIGEEALTWAPKDLRADGFSNTAYNLTVDLKHVEAYAKLAEKVVERMDWNAFLETHVSCHQVTEKCLDRAVRDIGEWIFRGTMEDFEQDAFAHVARTVVHAGGDFREAMQFVVEGMLQAPRFLYRIEKQVGDGSRWPVGYDELASRMSYIIWGASPDRLLLDAAKSGKLFTRDGILAEVNRMLKDPRAKIRSEEFLSEWLHLGRLKNIQPNGEKFPDWKSELAEDMNRETLEFFEEVVWNQKRRVSDLFNAKVGILSARLAKHYGLEPALAEGEAGWSSYDLSNVPGRGGILTHGSVLTVGGDEASMVARGLFVLHDVLRGVVKDPPPCVDTTPVPAKPGLTQRGIALERINNPNCGGCHSRFEPLAFGLEKFDGLGSYHEKDEFGNELRDDGEIIIPGTPEPLRYQSSEELMDLLANHPRVQETITWKLAQFALGRSLVAGDVPIIQAAHEEAMQAGGTYPDLIRAIILSELVLKTPTEPAP